MASTTAHTPDPGPTRTQRTFRWLWLALLYLIVASVVHDTFMTRWGLGRETPGASLTEMVHQEADRPYAFRVLTPAAIKALARCIPDELIGTLEKPRRYSRGPVVTKIIDRYGEGEPDKALYLAGYLLLFAAALAVLVTWRVLLARAGVGSLLFRDLAPVVAFLLLPLTFANGGYLYDMPELLFFSLALLFLFRRKWILYYAVFLAAMLNKEASLLLAAWPIALYTVDRNRRALACHLGLHAAIGLPILLTLRHHFAANPGVQFEERFAENLAFFLEPRTYLRVFDVYAAGLPAPGAFNILSLAIFGLLVGYRWREKDPLLRRIFGASVVVVIPFYLAFGFHDEVRVFALAFPALFLLGTRSVSWLYAR